MIRRPILAALALALAPLGAAAQQDDAPPAGSRSVRAQILLIDSNEAFVQSDLGQRISSEIETASLALAAENREMEADLIAEERALTQKRGTLPSSEFRKLADAFDEKVRRIRDEQDSKARTLAQRGEAGRREFLTAAQPVLEQIMRETGAVAILEIEEVFLGAEAFNITDYVVARLNAAGTGGASGQLGPVRPGPVRPAPEQPGPIGLSDFGLGSGAGLATPELPEPQEPQTPTEGASQPSTPPPAAD